jgi:uncharacterized membrane protein YbhN (UPF0104 family)
MVHKKAVQFFTSKTVRWLVKLSITALFAYMVNRSLNRGDIAFLIERIDPWIIALVVFCMGVSLFAQALRWQYLLRAAAVVVPFSTVMQAMLWGNTLAFVTPGRVGELLKGIGIFRQRQKNIIYTIIADKIIAAGTILLGGIICSGIFFFSHSLFPPRQYMVIFGIVTGIAFIGSCIVFIVIRVFRFSIPLFDRFRTVGMQLGVRGVMIIALLSICIHTLLLVQTVMLLRMFEIRSVIDSFIAIGQAYAFMTLVPLFIANIGIREYAFTLFLHRDPVLIQDVGTGVTRVTFGVSLIILVVNILVPAFAGLIWMLVTPEKKE